MYAIVNIAGEQFKVRKGDELRVPRTALDPGKKIVYDEVLFVNDGKEIKIGTPFVKGFSVQATAVEHGRTGKIPVFKKKRRKGYRVKNTHRQEFSIVRVDDIRKKAASKAKPAAAKKKSAVKKEKAPAGE